MSAWPGLFVTFEGGEGSGKTTQIRLLADALQKHDREVLLTREPGGTHEAEAIRRIVVEGGADRLDAVSETLLFLAARKLHWEQVIHPALMRGALVLCDRFADSTLVYQGIGKGLGIEYVRQLSRLALGNIAPDITFVLDLPPEAGLKRAAARAHAETRFEDMDMAFHLQVREGFRRLAQEEPLRMTAINAEKKVEEIHAILLSSIEKRILA